MLSNIKSMNKDKKYIDLENRYGAHNYHPLPVVLSKGEGFPCLWILTKQDQVMG